MADAIIRLNSFGDLWWTAVVRATWQGGVALLLALCVSRFVPRLSARVKCWIWRLACLKVLVAFLWPAPIDLPVLTAVAPPSVFQPLPIREPTGPIEHFPPKMEAQLANVTPTLPGCFLGIWLAGVMAGAVLIGRDLARLRNLRRGCSAGASATLGNTRTVPPGVPAPTARFRGRPAAADRR